MRPARVGGAIPEGPPATTATASSSPPVRPTGSIEPARPEVYNVRFSMSLALKEKLERMAEVLGIHRPEKNLATLLERLLEIGLEQKDPERKLARRRRREARKAEKVGSPHRPGDGSAVRSRYIPAVIRERVLERAGYRCEYESSIGVRCIQRTGLNIDHVRPYELLDKATYFPGSDHLVERLVHDFVNRYGQLLLHTIRVLHV